jgi:two-component system response regulator RegX3
MIDEVFSVLSPSVSASTRSMDPPGHLAFTSARYRQRPEGVGREANGAARMAGVVVIEERDHARVATLLTAEGMTVEPTTAPVDVVLKQIHINAPDLVVFEVHSLTRAVVRACAFIRGISHVPITVLFERGGEREIVDAYGAGADAVIAEPIGPHELVARVRAALRRAPQPRPVNSDVLTVGPIELDRARRQITVRGELIPLPRKEFDIAEVLMLNAGAVVSRTLLIRDLWGSARDTKTLDVQVGRLRARLAAAEGRRRILTIRGLGYRFATDDDLDAIEPNGAASSVTG